MVKTKIITTKQELEWFRDLPNEQKYKILDGQVELHKAVHKAYMKAHKKRRKNDSI